MRGGGLNTNQRLNLLEFQKKTQKVHHSVWPLTMDLGIKLMKINSKISLAALNIDILTEFIRFRRKSISLCWVRNQSVPVTLKSLKTEFEHQNNSESRGFPIKSIPLLLKNWNFKHKVARKDVNFSP